MHDANSEKGTMGVGSFNLKVTEIVPFDTGA